MCICRIRGGCASVNFTENFLNWKEARIHHRGQNRQKWQRSLSWEGERTGRYASNFIRLFKSAIGYILCAVMNALLVALDCLFVVAVVVVFRWGVVFSFPIRMLFSRKRNVPNVLRCFSQPCSHYCAWHLPNTKVKSAQHTAGGEGADPNGGSRFICTIWWNLPHEANGVLWPVLVKRTHLQQPMPLPKRIYLQSLRDTVYFCCLCVRWIYVALPDTISVAPCFCFF